MVFCFVQNFFFGQHMSQNISFFLSRFRDLPFNLKGGGGGYGFLFRSKKNFRTTNELEYFFLLSRKARNFFPEFNIRFENSESDYFFFLHQNHNIFFSNIGNQNILLEKNHNPPFKLNGRSLNIYLII